MLCTPTSVVMETLGCGTDDQFAGAVGLQHLRMTRQERYIERLWLAYGFRPAAISTFKIRWQFCGRRKVSPKFDVSFRKQ